MNNSNNCPPGDVIAAFVAGDLQPDALATVQVHVAQCDSCLQVVGHLATKLSLSELSVSDMGEVSHPTLAQPEQVIGPYRLIRKVGEGGMGEVWEAQQSTPVRRVVALKLLKAGMDTRQIVTRFAAERQVLALMQHPGIAQVFDAGITAAGRPYFVMEFVDGVRITAYCDAKHLGLQERLKLFQQVCEAVQHAHHKGVIHRDIKPSNVLITTQADKALPKVIDFGLAKAIAPEQQEYSLTEMGTALGTPAYASPEQMSLGAQDVDTRSDVYSLGALLYELLVGVIPFDLDAARPEALIELRRTIRDREPTRPSARMLQLGERMTDVAKARSADATTLRRQLRGDLDWIVMKALEKERERRYASPHELLLDIQRYLQHEPLLAGPPSATYRLRKFVRRHRVSTVFAAAMGCLIIAFIAVTVVQARRIADERDHATAEAAKANSINAFLQETLGSADPWRTGADISIREVLAKAAAQVPAKFPDEPLVAAAVQRSISRAYLGLGRLDEAEKLLRATLDTRIAILGREHVDVAESWSDLSDLFHARGNETQAEQYARDALRLRRKLKGDHHESVAVSLLRLSEVLYAQGEYPAAAQVGAESLAMFERLLGPGSEEVADNLQMLAAIAVSSGELESAERFGRRGYDINEGLFGSDDVRTATAANELGSVFYAMRKYDQAAVFYKRAFRVYTKQLSRSHPSTVIAQENLANALVTQGRFDESLSLLQEVLAERKAVLGDEAPAVARTMVNIAAHQLDAGRLAQAQHSFEQAVPRFLKAYGDQHPDSSIVLTRYARLLIKQHKNVQAESLLRQSLAIQVVKLDKNHPQTARTRYELGSLLIARAEFGEAETLLLPAHAVSAQKFGTDNTRTVDAANALVQLYTAWGKPDKAVMFRPASPAK